ncbi:NADH dehydrogenase [ubiquinone] 1 beta subcomplex subunit 6-like [Asterias rubens]|uniref:NADH dehydrogenase [ubiquinone] 1 beta subcomplex subunit 6-like n=1 Tax=Asterias rubens TaxID=7604 RepID=UPI0014551A80|nr:NADH dehydrogenase [ubiquinone] 1 beta subcomplex subunit 6-like [Asterias rubens]
MAACPPLARSRNDVRPPAGANPKTPAWAQKDYVLKNWIKEERQRRRNFLADQVLEPNEPRPEYLKPGKAKKLWFAIRKPFWNALWPLNEAMNYRLFHGIYAVRRCVTVFLLPMWLTHYVIKYHVATVPGSIQIQKAPIYPGDEDKVKA